MNSFIVEFWSRVFAALAKVSTFGVVTRTLPGCRTARFVDAWVLGHLALAWVALFVAASFPGNSASKLLALYGVARVFEIAVYQANVLLFDEYRAVKAGWSYAISGYRRMVLLLLHNYAEIIIWMAAAYTVLAGEYAHKWEGGTSTILGGLYSSFIAMTTFGDFDLLPRTNLAAAVLLFHATVGIFMTLLSLARFISLIPAPRSRDALERKDARRGPPGPSRCARPYASTSPPR